jgi:hypothetical protein
VTALEAVLETMTVTALEAVLETTTVLWAVMTAREVAVV